MVRFELLLLAELGFGLDLERAPGISKAMARQIYDYFHPRG